MTRGVGLALLVAFVLGATVGLVARGSNRAIEDLQTYADSVRRADSTEVAAALAFAAHERARADSLQAAKVPVRVVVRRNQATVDSLRAAVRVAQTAQDSNAVLLEAVAVLEHQVMAYEEMSRLDSLTLLAERARGDSLELRVRDLDASNAQLTARIARLRPPPRWQRIGVEVLKLGGAFAAGVQVGRR